MNTTIKFRTWCGSRFRYWGFTKADASDFVSPIDQELPHEQFTGLQDRNGKDIYDGDFIKTQFKDDDPVIAVVERDECNPCFVLNPVGAPSVGYGEYDFIQCGLRVNEVIGNIHENIKLIND